MKKKEKGETIRFSRDTKIPRMSSMGIAKNHRGTQLVFSRRENLQTKKKKPMQGKEN